MKSLNLALGILAVIVVGAGAWVLPEYYVDTLTKVMIFGILAISMELILGTTGLVSFGQAAFFGVGAYSVVLIQKYFGTTNLLVALLAAIAMSTLAGTVIGALSLRTRNIYFIMVTLAFAQMLYHFAHDTPLVGGSDGLYLGKTLRIAFDAKTTFQLAGAKPLYLWSLTLLAASFGCAATILSSRFGRTLKGIGSNEKRIRAVGFSPYLYKLGIFIFGSAMAGLAGFLYCAKDGAVNPEMMAWQQSGVVLLMVIIGGAGRLWGAVAGAAIYVFLQEVLSSSSIMGPLANHWLLFFGIAVIVIVAVWPSGFAGSMEGIAARLRPGKESVNV